MAGLHGFYSEGFPNLQKYQRVFTEIFAEMLPNLKDRFEDEGLPELMWITKWF